MTSLLTLLCFIWVMLLAFSIGRRLLLRIVPAERGWETASFGFALGLGSLAYILFIAGMLQSWKHLTEWMIGLSFIFFSLDFWQAKKGGAFKFPVFHLTRVETVLLLVLGLAVLQCFAPPTAHDAMAYHLDIPKRFVQNGGIFAVPFGVNSTFPLLMSMYYALATAWQKLPLAHLFHWAHGVAVAAGIFAFLRSRLSRQAASLAALIFILTPGIFNQMTIAYNDIAFCAFAFYAIWAALLWDERRLTGWLFLSGIFAGFALSVKYLGAIICVMVIMLILLRKIQKKETARPLLRDFAVFAGTAFLLSFVWYFRSWIHEGALLYFGGGGYEVKKQLSFWEYGFVPFRATFFPQNYGGTWAQLGPVYLAFLPLLMLLKEFPRWIRLVFCAGGFYFLAWLCLPRLNLRFLFPALPFWAIALAYFFDSQTMRPWAQKGLKGMLVLMLAGQLGFAIYHGRDQYPVALGLESTQDYLARQERTWALAGFMNTHLPPSAKVLNAFEVRMFWIQANLVREIEYEFKTSYGRESASPEEALARLRRDGFTHILWTPAAATAIDEKGWRVSALLNDPVLVSKHFRKVYQEPQTVSADGFARYVLYEILPS